MRLKRFGKFILIIVAVWLVIVVAGLLFSHSAQDKIINILTEQANKYLLCEIHIKKNDIHFSVFKKFPYASVELRNVCVKVPPAVNIEESIAVKGDTLLCAERLYLQMNLKKFFKKNYELEKISIHKGFIQFITDKKGNSSLNIFKKTEKNGDSSFSTEINSFSISDMFVYTSDKSNLSQTEIKIEKGIVSGTFSKDNFFIKVKSNGVLKNIKAKNQKLEPNQAYVIDTEIEFVNERYTIKRGYFNISNIPFKVIGSIRTGDNTLVDLIFSARGVSLKQVDRAILKGLLGENGFQPKGGVLDVQSTFIGYTRYSLPAIKASFKVKKGKFFDKSRNLLYEDIYISGNADNGDKHLPNTTTIRIDTFNFRTGESNQYGKLKIQNLIEPKLTVSISGEIDINDLRSFVKIPSINFVSGRLKNNIAIIATIDKKNQSKKEILANINAWGDLQVKNLKVEFLKYDIPPALINGELKLLKNKVFRFSNLEGICENTDITVNGELHNLLTSLPPKFFGSIHSNYFNTDDFISSSERNSSKTPEITFPDSIFINGTLTINNYVFSKFQTKNVKGRIEYKNKMLSINKFSMEGFSGNLTGNMILKQKKSGNIFMNSHAYLSNIGISTLFSACNNFGQDVITDQYLKGSLSGNIFFATEWTNSLNIIPSTIVADCKVKLAKGELTNYEPLMGLSSFIHVEELKHIKFDNLNTFVTIKDELVKLDQTHISSSALSFDGSGVHAFDNSYEYKLQVGLSDILLGKAKKKDSKITEFGYIVDDGVGHTMLPIVIKGKGTEYEVKYDRGTAKSRLKEKLKEERKELRRLFSNKDSSLQNTDNNINIEDTQSEKLQKTDSGKYQSKGDFVIEWDDEEE